VPEAAAEHVREILRQVAGDALADCSFETEGIADAARACARAATAASDDGGRDLKLAAATAAFGARLTEACGSVERGDEQQGAEAHVLLALE